MTSIKEDIENWILITLYTSHKGVGLDPTGMHFRKPETIEVDITKFDDIIDGLKKEDLVKQSLIVTAQICITNKGQRELRRRLRELKRKSDKRYMELISTSPMYELKERVSIIEKFLVYSFFAGGLLIALTQTQTQNQLHPLVTLILLAVSMILLILASIQLSNLIIFAREEIRESFFEFILKFIDKYEYFFIYGLVILFIGAICLGLHIFLNFSLDLIIGGILLSLVSIILASIPRIKLWLTNFKKDLENKILK
ncbi:MAG: hypothetical protein WBD09_01780 [Halobacteriota archaeon]